MSPFGGGAPKYFGAGEDLLNYQGKSGYTKLHRAGTGNTEESMDLRICFNEIILNLGFI